MDRIKVTFKGGKGGTGCVSFRKEKYVPRGGPDGGNGGEGGNVILTASNEISELPNFGKDAVVCAENGSDGSSKNRNGKNGKDRIVAVPLGTIVIDDRYNNVLKELKEEDACLEIVRGGRGGAGNTRFASATNRVPAEFEKGGRGEKITVILEMKIVADIAIVGFPNAGKSTILKMLTGSNVKIAEYPFTTLHPNLGVMVFNDYSEALVAEIPGIIENASKGAGIGNSFLKHIERTGLLVHIVECIPFEEGEVLTAYGVLREELAAFNKSFLDKEEIIVLHKIDQGDDFLTIVDEFKKKHLNVIPVSSEDDYGIEELKKSIQMHLESIREKSENSCNISNSVKG